MTAQEIKSMRPAELNETASNLLAAGGRMQMVYAWYPRPRQIELRYVASVAAQAPFAVWRCEANELSSQSGEHLASVKLVRA